MARWTKDNYPATNKDKELAREKGRKGGYASGKSKQKKKAFKELLEAALEIIDPETGLTNAELLQLSLIAKGLGGDTKAYELVRDTIGEKPVQQVEVTNADININIGEEND